MARTFRTLTLNDRYKIEALLLAKTPIAKIANILHVHRSTIYREIKRATYIHTNWDLTEEERYNPDAAQRQMEWNRSACGTGLKVGNDVQFLECIEKKIIENKYSPAAALAEVKEQNLSSTTVSIRTLYRYIDHGVFLNLTNKDLPEKKKRKRKYRRVQKKASRGDSIELRPAAIGTREEFGHWEMDTVVGKRGKSKQSLLVLSERKTRKELITLLPNHTAEAVVNAIDDLETEWGTLFTDVFKTITVDNGTEFSDYEGIERSTFEERKRTKVYYCHAYSSYERGTNENTNKLIRRHLPKGSDFDNKNQGDIIQIQDWINNYPRRILGYKSAGQLFAEELEQLQAA